jgi:hypothetical protein
MVVVAKPLWLFNMVAVGLWAIGLGMGAAGSAWAASGDDVPVREAPSPEPVLKLDAPDGYCAYDTAEAGKAGHATGFEPGLKSGTELMALYVPCASLDAARSGTAEWLPEWVAIEKNIVTYPSDDDRSLGSAGAVAQLCQDAQSAKWGHPRYDGADFAEMVKTANAKLSYDKPEIFLGVIGEDEHACYLSSLRIVFSPSGKPLRFLIVTAFMQAGDRWVTQSIRRELAQTRESAEAVLASAKKGSKLFSDKNR